MRAYDVSELVNFAEQPDGSVKIEAKREPEHGERGPPCNAFETCGGRMTWCAWCKVWSRTCCVPYGTCQCS